MNSNNTTEYVYQRERKKFGKQCYFTDKNELLFSESSSREIFREYILQDPVSQGTQISKQMALSQVNTERAMYESRGINHTEGGWPKDVSQSDPEQTTRYRRKIEKDETYISQVMGLTKPMEHCIFQNNATNIYETFFESLEPAPLLDPCSSKTLNVYRDPCQRKRPVSHLSWSPDGGSKLAVSYCDKLFQVDKTNLTNDSYIWEIGRSSIIVAIFLIKINDICFEHF